MIDEQKTDKGKEEAKFPAGPVAQQPAAPPQQPPAPPNANQPRDNPQPPGPPGPILVQLVGGDDLEPFEEQTLALARENIDISRKTYRIAVFAFIAAALAAGFVFIQVKEMSYQTQILASQSESAAAGALLDQMNTRRQLDIVQNEVQALTSQSTSMATFVRQQKQTAALAGLKEPLMKWHPITTVWNDGKKVMARIVVYNQGTAQALLIRIAPAIGFRQKAPAPEDYRFSSFRYAVPRILDTLNPALWNVARLYPVIRTPLSTKGQFYVWGIIRYSDLLGNSQQEIPFCGYDARGGDILAKVTDSPNLTTDPSGSNTTGYETNLTECPIPPEVH